MNFHKTMQRSIRSLWRLQPRPQWQQRSVLSADRPWFFSTTGRGGDGDNNLPPQTPFRLRPPRQSQSSSPRSSASPPPPPPRQQQQQRGPRDLLQRRNNPNRRYKTTPDPTKLTGYKDTRAHALHFFPGDYGDDEAYDPFGEDSDFDKDEQDIEDAAFNDPAQLEMRDKLRIEEEKILAQRKRWILNSFPKQWPTVIDERGRSYGRGGRKTSSARVWIQPGFGEVVVNRKPFTEYFIHESDRDQILLPFVVTETIGLFDVQAMVQGGGTSGQAGAVRHGVARALNAYNPELYRPALKFKGYITRDPRKVERKKVGLVKARKAPQWVRR